MKCIQCGKEDAEINNLCKKCFRDTYIRIEHPSKFELKRCPHCSAVKIHGEWIYDDKKLIDGLSKKIKISYPVDKFEVNGKFVDDGYDIYFVADVEYVVFGNLFREFLKIPVKIQSESCTICSRYYGNYFEAIVQVRGARSIAEEEIIKERFYDILREINDPSLFVNKEERVRGGLDIYVSNKHHAKQIVNKLSHEFGATVKESPQIAGRRDGQDLYRVTYSLRLPPYRKGDIVKISGKYFAVKDITNKGFSALEIDSGKILIFKHREFEKNGKLLCKSSDIYRIQVVYEYKNTLQILNPLDYEVIETLKPPWYPDYSIGGFINGDELIIVPII